MDIVLLVTAAGTALAAAALSTWSPCGRSMLSTLTPVGARGRGVSYRATVGWFVAGATAGGACLGAVMALAAWAVHTAGAPTDIAAAAAAGAAASAALSDRVLGPARIPGHHRQVNERWLDRYRTWVYGAGFGWQIGTGFATYVTTAMLYLLVVLAALLGSPAVAFGLGAGFGVVRGVAVLLGRRITSPDALLGFHRRFDALEAPARSWSVRFGAATAVVLSADAVVRAIPSPGTTGLVGATIAVAAATFTVGLGAVLAITRAGRRRRTVLRHG